MPPGLRGRMPNGAGPAVVALGGGHGLAASLRALRRVTDDLTAVVGVSDNGGSSGRLRDEFGVPPPGDLRMALAALCGDDSWGRTWSRVVQHRFSGTGDLRGHSLGNLLITSLWEETGDVVTGLDWVAALLGAQGRVLPVALEPLEIIAETLRADGSPEEIRGQVQVASTSGRVSRLRIEPSTPLPCPEALQAVAAADHVVLGPGSWYTSVLAPMLVPQLRRAVAASRARRHLVLNLTTGDKETRGFAAATHLRVWREQFPDLRLDTVIADPDSIDDLTALRNAAAGVGAQVRLHPLCAVGAGLAEGVHDPDRLAAAFALEMGRGSIAAWR